MHNRIFTQYQNQVYTVADNSECWLDQLTLKSIIL